MPARTRRRAARKRTLQLRDELTILALGAHVDDIELGCGATLLYLRQKKKAKLHYVVFCDHDVMPSKISRAKEIKEAVALLRCKSHRIFHYTDTEFPKQWREIQRDVENLIRRIDPDLILAPRLNDNHQDHVVVAEAARRECRHGQALWHYEIKQHGQDLFHPTIFIDVSGSTGYARRDAQYRSFLRKFGTGQMASKARNASPLNDTFAHRKIYILRKSMRSQLSKSFMHPELLLGAMRVRGMQASPETRYAEAFEGKMFVS